MTKLIKLIMNFNFHFLDNDEDDQPLITFRPTAPPVQPAPITTDTVPAAQSNPVLSTTVLPTFQDAFMTSSSTPTPAADLTMVNLTIDNEHSSPEIIELYNESINSSRTLHSEDTP